VYEISVEDPGSGMGENPDPGSGMGINIPDPQHCAEPWVNCVALGGEQRIPRVCQRIHRADPAHLAQGEGSFQGDRQLFSSNYGP